jgi:aspartate aminotransferase
MAFANVTKGLPDPMQDLKKITDADSSPDKIDLGAGVYRNEDGHYHEFHAITKVRSLALIA